MWDAPDAIRFGRAVVKCIKTLENELMKQAPNDFPNRIDADGYAENEMEKVRNEIARLEVDLSMQFDSDTVFKEEEWSAALQASRESVAQEVKFIQSAEFLRPIRHLDRRDAIELEYLKSRLAYLSLLRKEWRAAVGS